MVHNAAEGMLKCMENYEQFLTSLRHVCHLVRRPWSRSRLLETCFACPRTLHFRALFLAFDGHVHEGRWGTIVHAVDALGSLEAPLRQAWSVAKFSLKESGPLGREFAGEQVDVQVVDAAVKSQQFWSFRFMVSKLGATIEHLLYWADSCPCHGQASAGGEARGDAASAVEQRTGRKCPMQGRQAPELAAGRLLQIVNEVFETSHADVALNGCRGLGPADLSALLRDFDRARHFLTFTLAMKTACFAQPPLIFTGSACSHAHRPCSTSVGPRR